MKKKILTAALVAVMAVASATTVFAVNQVAASTDDLTVTTFFNEKTNAVGVKNIENLEEPIEGETKPGVKVSIVYFHEVTEDAGTGEADPHVYNAINSAVFGEGIDFAEDDIVSVKIIGAEGTDSSEWVIAFGCVIPSASWGECPNFVVGERGELEFVTTVKDIMAANSITDVADLAVLTFCVRNTKIGDGFAYFFTVETASEEEPTEATTEASEEEPTEATTEAPEEEPAEATTEAPEEESAEATTEAPEEEPTEITTEASTEGLGDASAAPTGDAFPYTLAIMAVAVAAVMVLLKKKVTE